jgi:hypothetical protein
MESLISNYYYIVIVLSLISSNYESVKKSNPDSSLRDTNPNSEILSNKNDNYSISSSNDSIRVIDNIRMERVGKAYIARNINGYNYIENYPLILNKEKVQGNKVVKILFYENDSTLQKVINIKNANPYLQEYDSILYEKPSFEKYKQASDSLIKLYDSGSLEPDKYLTIRNWARTQVNGFSFVSYDLIPAKGNRLLAWRSKVLIIDVKGNIIRKIGFPEMTHPVLVSNNGQLLVVLKGYTSSFSISNYPRGEFAIVDLNTGKEIFSIPTPEGYRTVNAGPDPNNRFVKLGYVTYSDVKTRYIHIIDLKERKLYRGELEVKDYLKFFDNNTFIASNELLDQFKLELTKF